MVAMSIFFIGIIASKARLASAPPAASASASARGDLPGDAPAVLAPTALALLAVIADDRVPVAIRLFLIVRRDLERKGLAVRERRAAVEKGDVLTVEFTVLGIPCQAGKSRAEGQKRKS
jgi:hypothetical protein